MEKGPFSLFDFMGYFFPGALAMYLIVMGQGDIISYFSIDFFLNTAKPFLELPFHMILFYIIVSYCLGHFLSFFSTLTVEKYTRLVYGDPSKNLLSESTNKGKHPFRDIPFSKWRGILIALAWPLIVFDFIAVKILKYEHSYLKQISKPYLGLVRTRISDVFREMGLKEDVFSDVENNYHQFLIHYNYEFTKYHGHKLMNYISLYGFLRVITLISCLFGSYLVCFFITRFGIDLSFEGLVNFTKNLAVICISMFATFVFYLGYLKFYRRYTQENLMLVLIVSEDKK